jgi:hypothetical protein
MKRFPSLRDIGATLGFTLLRFAPVVAAALGGTACAIAWVEQQRPSAEAVAGFSSAMMAFGLSVPVLFAVCLYRELFPGARANLLMALGAALAPVYFLSLRLAQTPLPEMQVERFAALWAGAHFLVAVVPFLARRGDAGFWKFNERLFLRYLLGSLYAGVLYVGLALALLSVDRLLSLHIPGRAYANLGLVLAGAFHPIFFLAGVPRDFQALEAEEPHPAGLRRFVQFVLLPLVAVYLGILYLYAGKIALTWRLPNGWLARPVLILSVIGILRDPGRASPRAG